MWQCLHFAQKKLGNDSSQNITEALKKKKEVSMIILYQSGEGKNIFMFLKLCSRGKSHLSHYRSMCERMYTYMRV